MNIQSAGNQQKIIKEVNEKSSYISEPISDKSIQNVTRKTLKAADRFTKANINAFKDIDPDASKQLRQQKINALLFESSYEEAEKFLKEKGVNNQGISDFKKTKQSWDKMANKWKQVYSEIKNRSAGATEFFTKRQKDYDKSIDDSRLADPSKVSDPHPDNVRVLASSQQAAGSMRPEEGEKADWATRKYGKALKDTGSVDEAFEYASSESRYWECRDGNFIQKPVTTKRHKDGAWQKIDNDNPDVKRIAVFIEGEDGSGGQTSISQELQKNFKEQSVTDYKTGKNPEKLDKYRINKKIIIKQPSEEELKNGIIMEDKIKDAYKQVSTFRRQEIENARKEAIAQGHDPDKAAEALKFEATFNWFGHGGTDENIKPKGDDYVEGNEEFQFIHNHSQKPINESTIKNWEREFLQGYSYCPTYMNACTSGAFTY